MYGVASAEVPSNILCGTSQQFTICVWSFIELHILKSYIQWVFSVGYAQNNIADIVWDPANS